MILFYPYPLKISNVAKDPAFLFYPGDYLRDTQCLSENVQVAYDRIMCEHIRNISISYEMLCFFTKRLNAEEMQMLTHLLIKTDEGYHIQWVYDSICKRRSYSESRRKNRAKKKTEDMKTYDTHMEIEIVLYVLSKIQEEEGVLTDEQKRVYMYLIEQMVKIFMEKNPEYFFHKEDDYHACLQIAYKIAMMKKWSKYDVLNGKMEDCLGSWRTIVDFIKQDTWLSQRSLSDLSTVKEWQRLVGKMTNGDKKQEPELSDYQKQLKADREKYKNK